jgi:hypothetical protein
VVIAGKRARTTERQRTGSRSGLPWLVRVSGYGRAPSCRRRGSSWRRSIIGSSSGPSSARSVKPATKRRRRQCRAVPGGDRRQVMPKRRRGSAPATDRGCRGWSGCRVTGVRQVAAGVARAGGTRTPAVLPGLRPLDRSRLPRGDNGAGVEQCLVVIAGQRRQVEGNPALPWSGPLAVGSPGCRGGVQADCRQVGLLPVLPVSLSLLHRRQFAGPSFSRSLKAAAGQ